MKIGSLRLEGTGATDGHLLGSEIGGSEVLEVGGSGRKDCLAEVVGEQFGNIGAQHVAETGRTFEDAVDRTQEVAHKDRVKNHLLLKKMKIRYLIN